MGLEVTIPILFRVAERPLLRSNIEQSPEDEGGSHVNI